MAQFDNRRTSETTELPTHSPERDPNTPLSPELTAAFRSTADYLQNKLPKLMEDAGAGLLDAVSMVRSGSSLRDALRPQPMGSLRFEVNRAAALMEAFDLITGILDHQNKLQAGEEIKTCITMQFLLSSLRRVSDQQDIGTIGKHVSVNLAEAIDCSLDSLFRVHSEELNNLAPPPKLPGLRSWRSGADNG